MDVTLIVYLVKERLGIRSSHRDTYITAIVNGVIEELEGEKGLSLNDSNSYHLLFICDYAAWRYKSVSEGTEQGKLAMPRHLQYRLHNLMIHVGGGQHE